MGRKQDTVGHKYVRRTTVKPFACTRQYEVTVHSLSWALHSTKGWRLVHHHRATTIRSQRPTAFELEQGKVNAYRHGRSPASILVFDDEFMERARLRHPWYQKQKAWADAFRELSKSGTVPRETVAA